MQTDVTAVTLAPEFAVILITATALGYLARLTGQPALIAYILTGLLLGPAALGIVEETELIGLMAELGLGFLLFLIGLEMDLGRIRDILRSVVVIGVGQRVLQTSLAFIVAYALGFTLTETVIIALAINVGSTAVIVTVLSEKDELTTLPGRLNVGVLVFQDIYLLLVLAVLNAESLTNPADIVFSLVTIFVLMSFIAIFALASSRYVLPRLFDRVARNEGAFFVIGIAWVFLFITTADSLDLSLEVGAFLAGISLAQLPYSTELERQIQPLTDFFMVIFFSSIGLRLAADDLFIYWQEALVTGGLLMVGNFLIMLYFIDRTGFSLQTSFLGAINMTQVSEFALVIGAVAVAQGYVDDGILGYLSLVAVLTMGLSTYLINYNHDLYRRVRPFLARFESDDDGDIESTGYRDHAIVVGYDELIEGVLPVLREHFDQIVIVDRDPANTEILEAGPEKYVYGDFNYGEIRHAAAIGRAAFVLSSSDQREVNERILGETRTDATVFVEASSRQDAAALYDAGADYVILTNVLTGDSINEHLKIYLYDSEFFAELVRPRLEQICQGELPERRLSDGLGRGGPSD